MNEQDTTTQQLKLARSAAQGDRAARQWVNELIHPVIDFQTNRFCRRFCDQNRYLYRCSLSKPVGNASADALLCEWGNASYGWMLNDLTHAKRLLNYEARNQAGLFDYLYRIANSLPFYERWKDWRFGRKINIPTYIQSIGPLACKIFYALGKGLELEMIAAQLNTSLEQIENISSQIVSSLTRHNRLYLLDSPRDQSLTSVSDEEDIATGAQIDVTYFDETINRQDEADQLKVAWSQLDAVEQFVLESLIVNELDAKSVLAALKEMDIAIKKDVSADQTTLQQLYYFKRKTLNRMAEILQPREHKVQLISKKS